MGIPTLITTNTESGDASSSFTSSIDSTYDEYMFVGTDIGPASDSVDFSFNGSTDGGSNYNVTKTTTLIQAYHKEDNSGTPVVRYGDSYDLAQSTAYQQITEGTGGGSDESCAFILHLFSPSNTTYVKHFYLRASSYAGANFSEDYLVAGYFNTTSAINAIDFKMSSGNFDGVIQMFGIK